MKTQRKAQFIVKGILFGIVAGAALTVAIMLLWNWLMPLIFGLTVITFWQALGILALSKILFGGGHGPHSRFPRNNREKYWKKSFEEKIDFAKMQHGKFKVAEKEAE